MEQGTITMKPDQSTSGTTFTPHKPEEIIIVKITKREAVLLDKLRKYSFGKFTVHKANGLLLRIEINDSQMIDEETDVDLV